MRGRGGPATLGFIMSAGRFLKLVAVAAVFAWFLRSCAMEGVYIASASMEPTLPVDTHALLDKLTYRIRDPRRGDIVVFPAPVPPHEEMVKRVIAVGGDTLELRDKQVLLNGAAQAEEYVRHSRPQEKLDGDTLGPITVPPDKLFVLGDNRDESDDSSVWKDPGTKERVYFVDRSRVRGLLRGFY